MVFSILTRLRVTFLGYGGPGTNSVLMAMPLLFPLHHNVLCKY
jgi:hypothetical protein